jgi:hypothetical protein
VEDSRLADLAVGSVGVDVATLDNCFEGNEFSSSAPRDVETLAPCEGTGSGDWNAGALELPSWLTEEHPPATAYQRSPVPPDQPTMPDAESSPPRAATDVPEAVDLDAIAVPEQ